MGIWSLPNLRVLYMKNNPIMNNIQNYRKKTISRCPNLKYLDDRPVFDDERRLVEAWVRNGREGEREERKRMKFEKEEDRERKHLAFKAMVARQQEERESL